MAAEDSEGSSVNTPSASTRGALLRFIKHHPLWSVLLLIFLMCGTELATGSHSLDSDVCLADLKDPVFLYQRLRAESAADSIVDELLAEIGHGVRVLKIKGKRNFAHGGTGEYHHTCEIHFAVGEFYESFRFMDGGLMNVLAHECGHAIIDQAGLYPPEDTLTLPNEMAAEVFAAHLCGRLVANRGRDGHRVTMLLLGLYRGRCQDVENRTPTHHGPVDVITDMHNICCDNPDLWTAAHAIAEKYFVVDETGEWKYRDGIKTKKNQSRLQRPSAGT